MITKITTLIENSPGEHHALKTEHGISFFIEKDGHKVLFDTGQTGTFIENAEQLRVDLTSLEYVVLSHGHYDHSGGLRHLTQITTDFELVLGEGFFDEKYGYKNNSYEYLGNNFDEKFLNDQGITYRFVNQQLTELVPGVYVVTCFPRIHADEVINARFKVQKDGVFQPDPFDDEVLLAVDSPEGLIVLLGCSHPGMKNMLDAASSLIKRPIYAVLGGTHLVESDKESLDLSMEYLKKDTLKVIGVSHCTGQIAMDQLAGSNERYYHNRTGSSLIVA
ncbi:MAG: MBL fold metallo-hydrolase [Bacteroidota bacterium]|nr:MBL fold metallo-hydrolase [Bacteroidota bacterium]